MKGLAARLAWTVATRITDKAVDKAKRHADELLSSKGKELIIAQLELIPTAALKLLIEILKTIKEI